MHPERAITIRRCTLRVTRRGGWSWGADAQTLTRRVIERLPALLEPRLGALDDALPGDLEIVQPLRLRVALPKQEWAELIGGTGLSAQTCVRLKAAIDAAMTQSLSAILVVSGRAAEVSEDSLSATQSGESRIEALVADEATQAQPSALWKLLSQWRAEGNLLARVAPLSEVVLQIWLDRLVDVEPLHTPVALEEARLPELYREVSALPLLMPSGAARTLARQLIFTLELKSRWAPDSAQTRELLARVCGDDTPTGINALPTSACPAKRTGDASVPAIETGSPTAATAAIVAHTVPPVSSEFEVDVPCALPFLLLTPLSRAGYFTRLAAALEAARAASLAGGVALGLARKCLAAPLHGWRRAPSARAAAAAFAGRRTCDDELILNAGRALRPQLAVLDDCVTDQLLRGHRAEAGWLVARSASDALVLFDEDGLVPAATGSLASLAARIAPSAGVLFLPAHAADAEHLDTLDELQIPYASDANLASRRSAASFIAPDGRRLWVSVHGAQQGRARALAERGATLTQAALANWSAVHDARTAQRPGIDTDFETTLSLAACFALSAIAWALWPHRARATVLAAVESFADLDARVRVTAERVQVTLPMGRRAWDLRDHGLLADVGEVPWLGGRMVTFRVG